VRCCRACVGLRSATRQQGKRHMAGVCTHRRAWACAPAVYDVRSVGGPMVFAPSVQGARQGRGGPGQGRAGLAAGRSITWFLPAHLPMHPPVCALAMLGCCRVGCRACVISTCCGVAGLLCGGSRAARQVMCLGGWQQRAQAGRGGGCARCRPVMLLRGTPGPSAGHTSRL